MKREGRQHGMVRTHCILPSPFNNPNRVINRSDSPPTAGLFTKVNPYPTNHSKFTGKCAKSRCNCCHMNPSSKSRDKTKGTYKLKSLDVVSSCRLLTWRVVDGRPGFSFSGFSATGMLDHLDTQFDDQIYGDDYYESESESEVGEFGDICNYEVEDDDDDDDDDQMSFCDLGNLLLDHEEDEGWCLLAEL